MGYPSDKVMVGELKDEEKDWVLCTSLLQAGFLTQAHPVEQQRLHGFWEQLCGKVLSRWQVSDSIYMTNFKTLHFLADFAVGCMKLLAKPLPYTAE